MDMLLAQSNYELALIARITSRIYRTNYYHKTSCLYGEWLTLLMLGTLALNTISCDPRPSSCHAAFFSHLSYTNLSHNHDGACEHLEIFVDVPFADIT